jgi:hypothetical protein
MPYTWSKHALAALHLMQAMRPCFHAKVRTMRLAPTWRHRTPAWVRSRAWGHVLPWSTGSPCWRPGPHMGGPDHYSGGLICIRGGPGPFRGSGLRTWGSGTHLWGPDSLEKSLSILPPWTRGSIRPTYNAGTGLEAYGLIGRA